MLERKAWKGECGKALCSDSAHWHRNGEKTAWKLQGGQAQGPRCVPQRQGWGQAVKSLLCCSSEHPERSALLVPKYPSNAPQKWFTSEAQEICTQTVYRLHVRLWPHITHSFLKSNLLGFYHSRSITVLSNYQNLTSEKASICLPSYFNLLSCAISPSGYWLEFCFVFVPLSYSRRHRAGWVH